MAVYKIHMRSFAPWREFGDFTKPSTVNLPLPPAPAPRIAPIKFGGSYHGDARGFSLATTSGVTARVHAYIEVDVSSAALVAHKAWCDDSRGPWMLVGPEGEAKGSVTEHEFTVSKSDKSVRAVIDYGASNPLVKVISPDINARGEFTFTADPGTLTIDAVITGDQFPACESFIEDPRGIKIFVGGFAPPNKGELGRLYGKMNKPQEVWFETHVVVKTESDGSFRDLEGGGSGSNATGPACENLSMGVNAWNVRIMGSIPMPVDAP